MLLAHLHLMLFCSVPRASFCWGVREREGRYVHAYQSYVWNRMVSARVRRHGLASAVPGDLVCAFPSLSLSLCVCVCVCVCAWPQWQ